MGQGENAPFFQDWIRENTDQISALAMLMEAIEVEGPAIQAKQNQAEKQPQLTT